MKVKVSIKWGKQKFEDVELVTSEPPTEFMNNIFSLTGVPVGRQKIMAKGAWKGMLKENDDLSQYNIKEGAQIMLMGTAEVVVEPVHKTAFIEDMSAEDLAKADMRRRVSLFKAVSTTRCEIAAVQILIDEGASVTATDQGGMTALQVAASTQGNKDIVQLLIDNGASLATTDKVGRTLLHLAATKIGNGEMVQFLINKGLSVTATYMYGITVLQSAVTTPGNAEIVQLLIDNGASLTTTDEYGKTALHSAATKQGNKEMVQCLIDKGLPVAATDKEGVTVLQSAVTTPGNAEIVQLLIDNGASLTTTDKRGRSMMGLAVSTRGNKETVRLLIDRGALLLPGLDLGQLSHAAASTPGNREIVQLLLDVGAPLPSLLSVAISSDQDTAQLLIQKGAPVHVPTLREGEMSSLHEAVDRNKIELAQLLIDNGASVNTTYTNCDEFTGWTALHAAAEMSESGLDMVLLLIESGASMTATNEMGDTPLLLALDAYARMSHAPFAVARYNKNLGDYELIEKAMLLLCAMAARGVCPPVGRCSQSEAAGLLPDFLEYALGAGLGEGKARHGRDEPEEVRYIREVVLEQQDRARMNRQLASIDRQLGEVIRALMRRRGRAQAQPRAQASAAEGVVEEVVVEVGRGDRVLRGGGLRSGLATARHRILNQPYSRGKSGDCGLHPPPKKPHLWFWFGGSSGRR